MESDSWPTVVAVHLGGNGLSISATPSGYNLNPNTQTYFYDNWSAAIVVKYIAIGY